MYNLPHLPCYTSAPMASMHEHVNACSWHQSKKWRQTLILACEENEQSNNETETHIYEK